MSVHLCSRKACAAGFLAVLLFAFVSSPALAQSDSYPKWDLFVGYQWLHPGGWTPTPFGNYNSPTPLRIQDMAAGFGGAFAYNLDSHFALEFDGGHNWGNGNYEATASGGPRLMFRTDSANYFLHTLIWLNRLNVSGLNASNGLGAVIGGGMELPITKNFAFRLFQVDYIWGHHNYSDFVSSTFPSLRRDSLDGVRLRTGFTFSWGGAPEVNPIASCSVQPNEVMVGEPITATATASNFNAKHTVAYAWSANGGQVSGKDTTAQIDTTNLAPGSYVVTAHVTDAKEKRNNEASCSANFTVKPLPPKNPPTISISASPSDVLPGGTVNLSASCSSPDGVSVSVASWTASSGTVSGSGTSATLNTAGVSPGTVTVNATCTDSRGLTAQGTGQVTIETPPPAKNPEIEVLEARLSLHSIYFATAMPPVRDPNAGLVPSQRQTLIGLATDFKKYLESRPDAHLILEGHADPRGPAEFNQKLSERRSARVKSFLVEQGVPEANIDTKAFGAQHTLTNEEVRGAIENNPNLTQEERQRALRNMRVIVLASDRRVDITLSTTGQSSVRQFPFNSADALTLIGGREGEMKKKPVRPAPKRKPSNQ
jgi:OmpA family